MTSAHFLIELFGFLMLSCMSCLYMLDVNPLSVISFTNIFSHSAQFVFYINCCGVYMVWQKEHWSRGSRELDSRSGPAAD